MKTNTESHASEQSAPVAKWIYELANGIKPIAKLLGWVLAAVVPIMISVGSYQDLDNAGWITHNYTTPVWIQGDWIIGEYRQCQMRTKTVPPKRLDLDSVDKLPRLFCGADANGLFDFQRQVDPSPQDVPVPPPGALYLVGVTTSELDHDFHAVPVRYNGRIDRTDKWVVSWRCQRLSPSWLESASFRCDALN